MAGPLRHRPRAPHSEDTGAQQTRGRVHLLRLRQISGLPLNPRDAFYYPDHAGSFFGFTAILRLRVQGFGMNFPRSVSGLLGSPNDDWTQFAPTSDGKCNVFGAQFGNDTHSVYTPRLLGPTSRRSSSTTAYIKSLMSSSCTSTTPGRLPHFTTKSLRALPGKNGEKVNCWPNPRLPKHGQTVVTWMTDTEENRSVAFPPNAHGRLYQTLSQHHTFHRHMHECNPATIPMFRRRGKGWLTYPDAALPPCASVICGVHPSESPYSVGKL